VSQTQEPRPRFVARREGTHHRMKIVTLGRNALGLCACVALLAACSSGGSQPPVGPPNAQNIMARFASHGRTFRYTGKKQSFKVPSGVTKLAVEASGASGPSQGGSSCSFTGGNGGIVKATISVSSGETLAIFVGGEGTGDTSKCDPGYVGGFNGGGNGASEKYCLNGTGGGGASDVRQGGDELGNRVIVAGGGGGGAIAKSAFDAGDGGDGGGNIGAKGTGVPGPGGSYGGMGGTQHRGGKGGAPGLPSMSGEKGHGGKLGVGGAGGNGQSAGCGGGGGGGYYGGGGGGGSDGASAAGGGGGGGGSSYIEPGATNTKNQRGAAPPGNGLIVISW
jgi:large repetitive protein